MPHFSGETPKHDDLADFRRGIVATLSTSTLQRLIEQPGIISDTEVALVYEAQDELERRADTAWQRPHEM